MSTSDARARILAAATEMFAARGYDATSVREVVDAAGVTKPMVYYYFGCKESLFVEAVQAVLSTWRGRVASCLEAPGTVRARAGAYLSLCLASATDLPDDIRLFVRAMHPTTSKQPHVDVLTTTTDLIGAFAAVLEHGKASGEIRADLHAPTAAAVLLGSIDLYLAAALEGAPLAPDTTDQILDVLFQGMSA